MTLKIAVLGGDLRQSYLAKFLSDYGFDVYVLALEKGLKNFKKFTFGMYVDIYILPVSVSLDGKYLNTPLSNEKISLDFLLKNIPENSFILGGNVNESINDLFKNHKLFIIDYFKRDELSTLNAIPTAEGALQIAFEEMPITLHNSKALVLGYGRIGKILANRLHALGAKTSVCARNPSDLAKASSMSLNPINLKNINYKDFDLIVNTIPDKILTKECLLDIDENTLIIDLASKPGGVDFDYATEQNLKVIWALSLPGKVAPITSAEIIFKTLINILNELEVI